MNIIELCFSNSWGGLEIYVGNYAKEFIKKKHNIIGFTLPESKLAAEFYKNNIQNFSISPSSKYLDLVIVWKMKSLISNLKIDIIHVHQSKDLSTAILLKKLLRNSKIVYSQQMDSRFNKNDFFHNWIYKNIDYVVTMTNSMRLNHLKNTPVNETKITTIYNGIDLQRFQQTSELNKNEILGKNNIPLNNLIIGSVARLDSLKNQEILIDAAALLINKYKNKLHLLFIGDETDSVAGKGYKKKLLDKVKFYAIDNHITFLGFTEEIEKYFDVMDIFVLPTDKESFGYVLIEAMAKGKPVIASNQGGPLEIIQPGKNGYLFEAKNHLDLASKILELINNLKLRQIMGKESRQISLSKFDIDITMNKYIELFQDLIKNSI